MVRLIKIFGLWTLYRTYKILFTILRRSKAHNALELPDKASFTAEAALVAYFRIALIRCGYKRSCALDAKAGKCRAEIEPVQLGYAVRKIITAVS